MGRLVLIIAGWFLILAALLIVWVASTPGRVALAQVGILPPTLQPRDVGLYFILVFSLGFMFLAGTALESTISGISRALTAGAVSSERSRSVRSTILWGGVVYLAIAALFAAYLIFFALPDAGSLDRLWDPLFLRFVLTWPYHLLAAAAPFGLSRDAFY